MDLRTWSTTYPIHPLYTPYDESRLQMFSTMNIIRSEVHVCSHSINIGGLEGLS